MFLRKDCEASFTYVVLLAVAVCYSCCVTSIIGVVAVGATTDNAPAAADNLEDRVRTFNAWYRSGNHRHVSIRVEAGIIGHNRGLGLVVIDPAGVAPGEVYLHVNTSLSTSLSSWLTMVRRQHDVADQDPPSQHRISNYNNNIAAAQQLFRRVVLDWVRFTHPHIRSDIMDAVVANDRPNKAAVQRLLSLLSTDIKEVLLSLWLMFEVHGIGWQASDVGPFLQLLPKDVTELSSVIFEQKDVEKIAILEGTVVYEHIGRHRGKLQSLYAKMARGLFPALKEATTTAASIDLHVPPTFYEYTTFQWAMGVLWSRQVWWDGEAHLAPMHDLANCRQPNMDSTSSSIPTHRTQRAHPDSDDYVVTRATDHFMYGEELFEHYGETNSFYLLFHGFALIDNARDCVILTLPEESDMPRMRDVMPSATRRLLQRHGLLREAPCMTAADLIPLHTTRPVGSDVEPSTTKASPHLLPKSIAQFISALRCAYLLTNAPESLVSLWSSSKPSAPDVAAAAGSLKQLGDATYALTDLTIASAEQRTSAIIGQLGLNDASGVSIGRLLRNATLDAVSLALALLRRQLDELRPQYQRVRADETKFLKKKLNHERTLTSSEIRSGASWSSIALYVRQQFDMLLAAEGHVANLAKIAASSLEVSPSGGYHHKGSEEL